MAIGKFHKEYLIRSYECDKHENLRLLTLLNILQDAADTHADALGVGYEFCCAHQLAWVAANYHVKVIRAPKIHEHIHINTWPSEERKLGAIRDYEIRDDKGELLVQASTQWVLINVESKRPQAIRANLPAYTVLDEKADPFEFTKLIMPEDFQIQKQFAVRFDDIDVNNHVNNAVYPLWISESLETTFRDTHAIAEIEIAFKKETFAGETVMVSSVLDGLVSHHLVTCSDDGRELARAIVRWTGI